MNKMGRLAIAAVLELVGVAGVADAQTTTLSLVKQRGALRCGVNAVLAGFGQTDDKCNWAGFDIDYCKAIAVALFGDATKVTYLATTNQQRFIVLQSGE